MIYCKRSSIRHWMAVSTTLPCLLFLVLSVSACGARYGVFRYDPSKRFLEERQNVLTAKRPSFASLQLLRLHFLDQEYVKDSQAVIIELEKRFRKSHEADLALVIAELSFLQARKYEDDNDRLSAIAWYLMVLDFMSEFRKAKPNIYLHSIASPAWRPSANIYNSAVSRIVVLWQEDNLPWTEPLKVSTPTATYTVRVRTEGEALLDPHYFQSLEPAYEFKTKGLTNRYSLPGFGAPLIGLRRNEQGKQGYDKRRPRPLIVSPVTGLIFLEPAAPDSRDISGILQFYDPLQQTTVVLDGETLPLEVDLSTSFGMFLSKMHPGSEDFGRLKRPDLYMDKLGIVMLEPYNPQKIPVLMVHGLYSSPGTYIQMFNDLNGNQTIRENYQFWFFSYPTGLPIIYSSYRLRKELKELLQELDPADANPQIKKMVVIGHSMGGILSKTLVSSSGDTLYDRLFNRPPEQLDLSDDERELVDGVLFFDAQPRIKRAVFIAAPHRGSEVARTFVGKIGRHLISLPGKLVKSRVDILERNEDALKVKTREFLGETPTSVHQLSPDSLMLNTLTDLPIAPGLPFHSIIGIQDSEQGPGSSDGIVPYESSHLEGSSSEKLVPEWHGCLEHPLTIAEVTRILLLHVKESGQIQEEAKAKPFSLPLRAGLANQVDPEDAEANTEQ